MVTLISRALGIAAILAGGIWVAQVQAQQATEGGHDMHATDAGDVPPSTQGFTMASDQMMRDMPTDFSGDANVDFARRHDPASPRRDCDGGGDARIR